LLKQARAHFSSAELFITTSALFQFTSSPGERAFARAYIAARVRFSLSAIALTDWPSFNKRLRDSSCGVQRGLAIRGIFTIVESCEPGLALLAAKVALPFHDSLRISARRRTDRVVRFRSAAIVRAGFPLAMPLGKNVAEPSRAHLSNRRQCARSYDAILTQG
jgi:hypothetical protein